MLSVAILAAACSGNGEEQEGEDRAVTDIAELQVRVREMIDDVVAVLPVDGLAVDIDEIREAQCSGPSDGVLGQYSYRGQLPEGGDALAIVEAAAEHWTEVGIPHDGVAQDDLGVHVFAKVEAPGVSGGYDLGVMVFTKTSVLRVRGSTPCVPGAVVE